MNAIQSFGPLVARVLLGLIFVWAGFGKVTGFAATTSYIASKGLPLPEVLAVAAIVLELGGGILVMLGWQARWAAWGLGFVCLFTAVFFHNFWDVPADQVRNQTIHFLKNLAILGGMLLLVIQGAGRLSLGHDKDR
jgi:putative oxidoreductase